MPPAGGGRSLVYRHSFLKKPRRKKKTFLFFFKKTLSLKGLCTAHAHARATVQSFSSLESRVLPVNIVKILLVIDTHTDKPSRDLIFHFCSISLSPLSFLSGISYVQQGARCRFEISSPIGSIKRRETSRIVTGGDVVMQLPLTKLIAPCSSLPPVELQSLLLLLSCICSQQTK